MNTYGNYIKHLEQLRINAKIPMETFCIDICSDRQYRRYLNNESTLSQKNLDLFLIRLGIDNNEFLSSFYASENSEYNKVAQYYLYLRNNNFKDIDNKNEEFKNYSFETSKAEEFFNICLLTVQFESNQISRPFFIEELEKIFNTKITNKMNKYTFIEILLLERLSYLTGMTGDFKYSEKLYDILVNKDFEYITSTTRYILPSIYDHLGIIYGMKGDIDTSNKIVLEGIEYSLSINDNSCLPDLYYMYSLGNYKQGKRDIARKYAELCIATCISIQDKELTNKFNTLFKREQGYELMISNK